MLCSFKRAQQTAVQTEVDCTQLRENISRQENKPVLESGLHVMRFLM